jgi:hypothetical protein
VKLKSTQSIFYLTIFRIDISVLVDKAVSQHTDYVIQSAGISQRSQQETSMDIKVDGY